MILPEDAEYFQFDFDIVAEEELEEEARDGVTVQPPATLHQGRGRGAGGGRVADRLPCDRCSCTYANESTLKTHKKKHVLIDLVSRLPEGEFLRNCLVSVFRKTLEKVSDVILVDEFQIKLHIQSLLGKNQDQLKMIIDFLFKHISNIKKSIKATLKSGVRSQFLIAFNKLCNNEDFMADLRENLEPLIAATSSEALSVLSGILMFNFFNELLLVLLREMLGSPAPSEPVLRQKWSEDDINSMEFQEIIYYIGGAVLHTFHAALRQHPECKKLHEFCDILKDRFQEKKDEEISEDQELEDSASDDTFELVKEWTAAMDRGGLIFLTKDAHNFFVALSDFVLCCEGSDGSLEQDFVFGEVVKNVIILAYWDNLIGEAMGESQSLTFLQAVCEVVVKVARQGILKRRLNAVMKTAYISVSLRHRLTR